MDVNKQSSSNIVCMCGHKIGPCPDLILIGMETVTVLNLSISIKLDIAFDEPPPHHFMQ